MVKKCTDESKSFCPKHDYLRQQLIWHTREKDYLRDGVLRRSSFLF
jgi:hypothetical protein